MDLVFGLKCLLDTFLCQKRRLHCAVVHYRAAFPFVCALRAKLVKQNVNGQSLLFIMNMYTNIKSCVFSNGEMSAFF